MSSALVGECPVLNFDIGKCLLITKPLQKWTYFSPFHAYSPKILFWPFFNQFGWKLAFKMLSEVYTASRVRMLSSVLQTLDWTSIFVVKPKDNPHILATHFFKYVVTSKYLATHFSIYAVKSKCNPPILATHFSIYAVKSKCNPPIFENCVITVWFLSLP